MPVSQASKPNTTSSTTKAGTRLRQLSCGCSPTWSDPSSTPAWMAGEDASGGIELFDMDTDPKQYTNLAGSPEHQQVVKRFKTKMAAKLRELRDNDLP